MHRAVHVSCRYNKNRTVPSAFKGNNEDAKKEKALVAHDDLFERAGKDAKSKATFNKVVDIFNHRDKRRRGHVEFIYAALKKMPEFGVERDITVYNKILDVFPKEVFVPRNYIQRMFYHYPRQQDCAVEVLEQMEGHGASNACVHVCVSACVSVSTHIFVCLIVNQKLLESQNMSVCLSIYF